MPISFSCSCGKRLKVADNLVGKKVKCPGCQSVTLVPAQDGEDMPTASMKATKPSMPAAKPGAKAPSKDSSAPAAKEKPGLAAKSKPTAPAAKRPAPPDDEPDLSDLFGGDEEE